MRVIVVRQNCNSALQQLASYNLLQCNLVIIKRKLLIPLFLILYFTNSPSSYIASKILLLYSQLAILRGKLQSPIPSIAIAITGKFLSHLLLIPSLNMHVITSDSLNKFKNNIDQYWYTKFDMDRLKGPWPINFQLT